MFKFWFLDSIWSPLPSYLLWLLSFLIPHQHRRGTQPISLTCHNIAASFLIVVGVTKLIVEQIEKVSTASHAANCFNVLLSDKFLNSSTIFIHYNLSLYISFYNHHLFQISEPLLQLFLYSVFRGHQKSGYFMYSISMYKKPKSLITCPSPNNDLGYPGRKRKWEINQCDTEWPQKGIFIEKTFCFSREKGQASEERNSLNWHFLCLYILSAICHTMKFWEKSLRWDLL